MTKKSKTIAGALSKDRMNLSFKNDLSEESKKIEKFNKEILVKVSATTFLQWKEAKKRIEQVCGYDNESKVFEFMLVEFLNIPIESYE